MRKNRSSRRKAPLRPLDPGFDRRAGRDTPDDPRRFVSQPTLFERFGQKSELVEALDPMPFGFDED
jgi:hypothetical protein